MKARDIMTKEIVVVASNISVADAISKMVEKKVSSLIVNRDNEDDTYGIVTRRDIVNKVVATGLHPGKVKVADVMTKPILTVYPDLSIKNVASLMVQVGVRRMPVFDGQQIIGMLSNSDIFRGYSKYLKDAKQFLD